MNLSYSIDESVLKQRLLELAATKSWNPDALSTLESFVRTADDYDLFRINPIRYGSTAGLSDATLSSCSVEDYYLRYHFAKGFKSPMA